MRWTHPVIGALAPLPDGLQPGKVWKHLYEPKEAWRELGLPIEALVTEVEASGARRTGARELPYGLPVSVLTTLRAQHAREWAPVYGRDLLAPDTYVGRSTVDNRWLFASVRGVYAAADDAQGTGAVVLSVYRPHPQGLNVPWSNEQYRRRALSRWTSETDMPARDPHAHLTDLARAPIDAASTWELALAVARARATEGTERSLVEAEAALAASLHRKEATPDPDQVLDEVERSVREEDDDPLAILLALQDAVLVTAELAGTSAAALLADRAGNLLEWAPPAWARIAPFAARQAAAPTPVRDLWARASEVLSAAALRAQAATARPEARIADLLIPNIRRKHTTRLAQLPRERVRRHQPVAGAPVPPRWRAPTVQLSGETGWSVIPPVEIRTSTVQAWLVDDEYPDGEDITEEFRAGGDVSVWTLSAGDQAEVVWVDGLSRAPSLADALDAAASAPGASVGVATISRPR